MQLYRIALIFFLFSCSKNNTEYINIVFQNNNHGKIKSCGCQKSPLGGQLALSGFLKSLDQKNTIYLSSGSHYLPKIYASEFKNSTKLDANTLSLVDKENSLKFIIPAPSDLALEIDFFKSLVENSNATELISHTLKIKNRTINLIGINQSMNKKQIDDLIKKFSNSDIILVSSLGMSKDKEIANKYPQINWIIGSQDEAFTQIPNKIGDVKIVQTSSQGHHTGHIKLMNDRSKDSFKLIPMNNEWRNKAKKQVVEIINKYTSNKIEVDKIEQQKLLLAPNNSAKAPYYKSCIECHQKQGSFWEKTSHSLAYMTLLKNNSEHNHNCIGCHSFGYQEDFAFKSTHHIFQLNNKNQLTQYISELNQISPKGSIIDSSEQDRLQIHNKWNKLDSKYQLKQHYANVQCLNCHDKDFEHPFNQNEIKQTPIQGKCIKCHNHEQSPSWYENKKLNSEIFSKMLKKVSCPKGTEL